MKVKFNMKIKWKQRRQLFHIGIVIVFITGLSLQPFASSHHVLAAENSEDTDSNEHSGGFLVETAKVEGAMDPLEAMVGIIDIEEGVIHGLTMTKVLETNDKGTLIIKIKPDGPVPISDLKGTAIAITLDGVCDTDNPEWVCIRGVEMTLTEQFAGTISLPGAIVEACYEGQCADDKEEDLEAMSLMLDEDMTIEDIEHDLNSINEIMQVVEERLEDAKESEQTIAEEEQENQVEQALENFDSSDSDQDELIDSAHDIQETYTTFNEHASELALTTAVVDDILKQVTLVLEQDAEELTRLEDELSEANESISKQKQSKQTQEAKDENEQLAESIARLKETMTKLEDKVTKNERTLMPLEKSSRSLTKQLHGFYDSIQSHSENLGQSQDEKISEIREALDVAEPSKVLEKQLNDVRQQMDDTELVEETAEHEQTIEEASKQATSSVLSVSLAKRIGELDDQIEEEINEKSATWEDQSEQLSRLEDELGDLVGLAQLPETLFLEYELNVLLKEKHDYRAEMFANISRWQQLLTTLKEKQEEIEEALGQHDVNQQLLDELAQAITTFEQRYTAAELSTIAQYLNISAQLERALQLSELIDNGQHVLRTIAPIRKTTDRHLHELEAQSSELVNKVLVFNTLNQESYVAFKESLAKFTKSVQQLERPIKQLNNHLAIAEDLLGNRVSEYAELQQMYATIDDVITMHNRLVDLIEDLDGLPYFEKVKDLITEIEAQRQQMESMVQ